ncbi:hypothetical protein ACFQQB_59440 [Nonomuraea rubra]|uniref:hypothetical protein n=1 Tax=Nonomuraea rubra TaxID=46180 RepID=UPI003619D9CA
MQIEAQSQTGWAIERGFSGGPVFDHHSEAVTGIVVLRDDHRSGHMLPISYLRTLWEEVRRSCGWRLDLDPHLPTHWLPRARGCELGTDEWHFTGRVEARRAIRDWLARPAPAGQPILLVTGGPGCGKSALLAHTLLAADPRLSATVPTPGPRPPAGAFDAALHLKGLTCDETAARLADALGATADEPAELLAAVSGLPPGTSFTVLVDALEEAASAEEARRIAVLLRQVAGTGRLRVLAGVRTAPPDSRHARVLDAFGQRVPRIDLEAPPYLRHADVADYVVNRLRGRARPGSWDLPAIGQAVARRAGHNFLIAQLVSDRLNHPAAAPPHPGTPGWEEQFPESVGQAMEDYLRACAPDAELVRRLLTALAFARGDGLPVGRTWLLMATGLGHGLAPAPADLHDVVQNAAHYLVEHVDPQAGQSTYRLYHDAIDDYLRERCRHPDPQRAITDALTAAVPGPDGQRDWSAADPYTLAHLAGHAAAAGRLDPLLDDPGYLVHALPGPLLTALPAATTAKGALAARVYRTSAYRHRAATPARRCWTLSFDAARHHAPALRRAFDTLLDTLAPRGGSRWRPYFAAGHAPSPATWPSSGRSWARGWRRASRTAGPSPSSPGRTPSGSGTWRNSSRPASCPWTAPCRPPPPPWAGTWRRSRPTAPSTSGTSPRASGSPAWSPSAARSRSSPSRGATAGPSCWAPATTASPSGCGTWRPNASSAASTRRPAPAWPPGGWRAGPWPSRSAATAAACRCGTWPSAGRRATCSTTTSSPPTASAAWTAVRSPWRCSRATTPSPRSVTWPPAR